MVPPERLIPVSVFLISLIGFLEPEWRVGPYAASSALKTESACLVAEDGLTDVERQLIIAS
jgi:hypothetical protein